MSDLQSPLVPLERVSSGKITFESLCICMFLSDCTALCLLLCSLVFKKKANISQIVKASLKVSFKRMLLLWI